MKLKRDVAILLLLIIALFGYSIYLTFQTPKIGYIDLVKVYNEFDLKKEKEKDLKQIETGQNKVLDSLKLNLELIKRNYISTGGNDTLKNDYIMYLKNYETKSNEFEIIKDKLVQDFDDAIWKQLNQYIKDYSKEKGYDLMLGANGSGAVMYANPAYEISDDVIKYTNEKYNGKN